VSVLKKSLEAFGICDTFRHMTEPFLFEWLGESHRSGSEGFGWDVVEALFEEAHLAPGFENIPQHPLQCILRL
jgi:hypothetical protein